MRHSVDVWTLRFDPLPDRNFVKEIVGRGWVRNHYVKQNSIQAFI